MSCVEGVRGVMEVLAWGYLPLGVALTLIRVEAVLAVTVVVALLTLGLRLVCSF